MNQDAGLMQQLKANNSRLAAIIEAVAVNEAEVATRHPESAAAQAVANGDVSYGGVVVVAPAVAFVVPVAPLVLPADPEEDAEEVIAVPAVAAPLAPAPVVINMEDVGGVPPPVEEAPHTGAEIMIVQRIERIVPVEGNIEGFDDKDDDFNIEEDYENDDYNIIQERTKVEVSSSTNKSESKDSEVSLENSKQEEVRQEEEAKVVASIKEAAEASIAEAVRVEAAEVVEMQNAVKQDEEMIGAIYNPIHDITQMSCNIISHRMFSSAVVAAGDEDEKVLDKSLWIAGTYGTNTQKGFAGYKGHVVGGTIGFDIGSDNYKDLVGIAYTKLDSKFKSNGSRSNTNIDSHIVTLYGQKELPKNFMIQAMFAYNHNIVKSKSTV
ncbi:MAG: autotransporter outer membrane beta-barrel domain-containing protein [Rickettsia slovaca]|uniref:autotransporter outer membrane beta-barrel domain-containing protein n=1 Tax=Rickettsia slovaca TaxID=35794 RepID=UPI003AF042E0